MANIEHREGKRVGRRSVDGIPKTLALQCDRCGKRVGRGGYLSVDAIAAKRRASQRRQSGRFGESLVWWGIWHSTCDETPNVTDYRIGVECLTTTESLLHTTAELLRNEFWLSETNWSGLIRRVLADTARNAEPIEKPKVSAGVMEGDDDD